MQIEYPAPDEAIKGGGTGEVGGGRGRLGSRRRGGPQSIKTEKKVDSIYS